MILSRINFNPCLPNSFGDSRLRLNMGDVQDVHVFIIQSLTQFILWYLCKRACVKRLLSEEIRASFI